jgi:hypothetical protein
MSPTTAGPEKIPDEVSGKGGGGWKIQISCPVLAFNAYKLPSPDPTYTMPCETAGEEATADPVVNPQIFAPVFAFKAYTVLSYEPT